MCCAPLHGPLLIYRAFFSLVLRRIDPETAHGMAIRTLRSVGWVPGLKSVMRFALRSRDRRLEVNALGITFPSPLGVAAGMDKNAICFEEFGALGFGFVEVGTVTALRQPGSERPRIRRLLSDRALLNWMGFPNDGAARTAKRMQKRTGETILGANIGRSRTTPGEAAAEDYRASVRLLAPHADFLVLNVSSPNTPGLRDMQSPDRLGILVDAVQEELREIGCSVPLLVKLSPDLSDEQIDAVTDVALQRGLDGMITVNTTLSRDGLREQAAIADLPGGISGAPLKARALEVLERVYAKSGDRLTHISVGGIETADDAFERILAGATLVQAHTGFVYGGPLWARRINRGLSRLMDERGPASLQDLIGTSTKPGSDPQHARPSKARQSAEGPVVNRPSTVV